MLHGLDGGSSNLFWVLPRFAPPHKVFLLFLRQNKFTGFRSNSDPLLSWIFVLGPRIPGSRKSRETLRQGQGKSRGSPLF